MASIFVLVILIVGVVGALAVGRQLRWMGEQTAALADTTRQLRTALASPGTRGQWGERMADDVLRAAGFVENVNYRKQSAVEGGGVPDFTFLLPRGLELHMDVKFPLDNYLRALDAASEPDRRRHRDLFARDVRQRVRELAARQYAAAPNSVACVLLFIPNEHLYAFIHETDPVVADEALARGIVLCSPLSLFAVLAVVRHAVDTFVLQQTSTEVLSLLGGFTQQWDQFACQMDKVGARLEAAQKEYDALVGTRRRMLDRQVDRIDELRTRRALAPERAAAEPG